MSVIYSREASSDDALVKVTEVQVFSGTLEGRVSRKFGFASRVL